MRGMRRLTVISLLILGALIFLFPFYWMVMVSLGKPEDFMKAPPRLFPSSLNFQNYTEAVRYIPFFRYFFNTLWISCMVTLGSVVSSSLVAYGFSKIKWPGREVLFLITLGTMMLPPAVTVIPLYMEFKAFGWLGSFKPLWVPAWFGSAWAIFLLRQFYRSIPDELLDSDKIDGAGHFQIWKTIILPMSRAPLAVVALFQFVWSWKNFFGPLIFLRDQNMYTLSLGLAFFQSRHGGTEWHLLMAAATLTTIPTIIIFFLASRYLIEGIKITSGFKG